MQAAAAFPDRAGDYLAVHLVVRGILILQGENPALALALTLVDAGHGYAR